jgi:hypothetical protein
VAASSTRRGRSRAGSRPSRGRRRTAGRAPGSTTGRPRRSATLLARDPWYYWASWTTLSTAFAVAGLFPLALARGGRATTLVAGGPYLGHVCAVLLFLVASPTARQRPPPRARPRRRPSKVHRGERERPRARRVPDPRVLWQRRTIRRPLRPVGSPGHAEPSPRPFPSTYGAGSGPRPGRPSMLTAFLRPR